MNLTPDQRQQVKDFILTVEAQADKNGYVSGNNKQTEAIYKLLYGKSYKGIRCACVKNWMRAYSLIRGKATDLGIIS